ncbi:hypothetical protein [Streptomyces sp.]|uniref:hypothetical protein n=1 Tax=Streptomyces sp. TaxID=1931 RepID=UPI002D7979FE|nr:hypothetical protein [Streptomyces sp.]HET6355445.1 hypothetical protein [Streptomyces sp.]
MTNVELIVAALAAGAAAGAGDTAKAAVTDAYTGLRDALRRRLVGRRGAEQALSAVAVEPARWQIDLAADLEETGAANDNEILAAAQRLLALAGPAGPTASGYRVDAREAKGVQVGDHNTQHNTFS